ncbi:hypothetical protein H696_01636 [Fonticula alba]|uniref:Phospholipid-transporting ATPase n=1 Tax=Fonticula alba TaxID=691883 RepID=A0A058ZCU6_FONAL|nr:hypothetical protein H696_01636 [Fonticula alba]KCV72235.1 hypothetical protein H696_01636 [Fonticula alba]|eukprot:XP_009493813.1 hypothetical protein H696_01636 [Fonticula alba]
MNYGATVPHGTDAPLPGGTPAPAPAPPDGVPTTTTPLVSAAAAQPRHLRTFATPAELPLSPSPSFVGSEGADSSVAPDNVQPDPQVPSPAAEASAQLAGGLASLPTPYSERAVPLPRTAAAWATMATHSQGSSSNVASTSAVFYGGAFSGAWRAPPLTFGDMGLAVVLTMRDVAKQAIQELSGTGASEAIGGSAGGTPGGVSPVARSLLSNTVRTARYTWYDFLPRQLLAQFSKMANFYFLLIGLLQQIPGISPTGRLTTILPLFLFVGFAILRELYDDFRRHQADKEENNRLVDVFLEGAWQQTRWKDVRVGHALRVTRGQPLPADCILLASSAPDGKAYVETSNLDGETNLKERRALEITQAALIPSPDGGGYGSLETGLQRLSGHVRCPAPTRQLDVFEATISLSPVAGGGLDAGLPGQELSTAETAMLPAFESFGLNPEQLLLRGTVVQGVDWLVCLVVYTGEQTRVRLNATQAPTKAASFDRAGSRLVILTFVFLCLMVVLFAVSGFTWQQRFQVGSWFLPGAGVTVLEFLTIYLILFNGIIPISLYVTLEFVRFMQSSFIDVDLQMAIPLEEDPSHGAGQVTARTDSTIGAPLKFARANTSTLTDELGLVRHIFVDKTGTLTENDMLFKKCATLGARPRIFAVPDSTGPAGDVDQPADEGTMADLLEQALYNPQTLDFILAMVLCHSVLPITEDQEAGPASTSGRAPAIPQFEGTSPDEIAIVRALFQAGVRVVNVTATHIGLELPRALAAAAGFPLDKSGSGSVATVRMGVDLLHVLPFSSDRRRMSVLVRLPGVGGDLAGRVRLIVKGADTVLTERARMAPGPDSPIEALLARLAGDGLRTLVYGARDLDADFYRDWCLALRDASLTVGDRTRAVRAVFDRLEWDLHQVPQAGVPMQGGLELIGVTAIADRLQKDVPETVTALQRAGMSLWMLTGDRRETALHVGRAARLIAPSTGRPAASTSTAVRTTMFDTLFLSGTSLPAMAESIVGSFAMIRDIQDMGQAAPALVVDGTALQLLMDFPSCTVPQAAQLAYGRLPTGAALGLGGDRPVRIEDLGLPSGQDPVAALAEALDRQQDTLLTEFLRLCFSASTVVCCRVAPLQKAAVVRLVRTYTAARPAETDPIRHRSPPGGVSGSSTGATAGQRPAAMLKQIGQRLAAGVLPPSPAPVTLAVGDGANDVAMLQAAHVGIGLSAGREGLAAARAADYAVPGFRHLAPLLLVHGHWNAVRSRIFFLETFYKCAAINAIQALFQLATGGSGASLFDGWTLACYNVLFTSFPVIVLGIFEKDILSRRVLTSLAPEVYRHEARFGGLNSVAFVRTFFEGILHAALAFGLVAGALKCLGEDGESHEALGMIVYSAVVVHVTLRIGFVTISSWSMPTIVASLGSLALWVIYLFFYSMLPNYAYKAYGLFTAIFTGSMGARSTLAVILVAVVCVLVAHIAVRLFAQEVWGWWRASGTWNGSPGPGDTSIVREFLHRHRRNFNPEVSSCDLTERFSMALSYGRQVDRDASCDSSIHSTEELSSRDFLPTTGIARHSVYDDHAVDHHVSTSNVNSEPLTPPINPLATEGTAVYSFNASGLSLGSDSPGGAFAD